MKHAPLPPSATDINYSSTVGFSRADFTISREQFIAWADSRNWQVTEIDDPQAFIPASRDEPRLVENGLQFDARDGDFGYSEIYDEDKRASIAFSTQ